MYIFWIQLVIQIACCSRELKRSEDLGVSIICLAFSDPHIIYSLCQTSICLAQFNSIEAVALLLDRAATSQNERLLKTVAHLIKYK